MSREIPAPFCERLRLKCLGLLSTLCFVFTNSKIEIGVKIENDTDLSSFYVEHNICYDRLYVNIYTAVFIPNLHIA